MKLCPACQNVFTQAVTECPMGDCGRHELIDVDDQLVDIVKGFWDSGIEGIEPFAKHSCAGHVWKDFLHGYLTFAIDAEYRDIQDLEKFRELLVKLNARQTVNIGEIEAPSRRYSSFRVSTLQCGTDRRERLKIQRQFIDFLYDVLDAVKDRLG